MTKKKDKSKKNPNSQKEIQKEKVLEENTDNDSNEASFGFPVVGIGASAGGLEAFEQFFSNIPIDTGMAFILITHLDPTHKSILSDLIRRYTRINVVEAEENMQIKPNCAYIIPPNRNMTISKGRLHLSEQSISRGIRLPIDHFFRSLATDLKEKAIGIILSGSGTDGTLGLREIKGIGGMTMVQNPESAKYNGMPRSAINNVPVDYILPTNKLPEKLIAYVKNTFYKAKSEIVDSPLDFKDYLKHIFDLLRFQTGHDFSAYKENTLIRRIERRMTISHFTQIANYIKYLKENPSELKSLIGDLLIGVTNFFRDKEAFISFQEKVIPVLFKNKSLNQRIRVWIPACSTGEEAYSVAIMIQEQVNLLKKDYKIQIFATDIDDKAIEKARLGIYPNSIAVDVSAERLKKFFILKNEFYQIKKSIRDNIVFAVQNVISDPPFSNVDLICCRNFLIYLVPEIQKKLLSLFYYSLNPSGFLFLGNSESVSGFSNFLHVIDRKWKIFQKKEITISSNRIIKHFPPLVHNNFKKNLSGSPKENRKISYRDLMEKLLLKAYSPPSVIIDENNNILYVYGHTGKFLEPSIGKANLNILKMARNNLKMELNMSIRKVSLKKKEVRAQNLKVQINGDSILINLIVSPIYGVASMSGLKLVRFEEISSERAKIKKKIITESPKDINLKRIKQLEEELKATKQTLQTTIEELETSNEELKSTNEELQSTNEELQSTNEELQTSKEELQSLNEELNTVNAELDFKITELTQSNDNMKNLLDSLEIGTIFLDSQFNIKFFTPPSTEILNLIITDIGRPIHHISSNLRYNQLLIDVQNVLKSLIPKEIDVQTNNNNWFTMRIIPYRTIENVINGIVITFININKRKRAEQKVQEARKYAENIVNTIREPLIILDQELRVLTANKSFYKIFQVSPGETENRFIYNLGNGQWDIPKLRELLEEIIPKNKKFENFKIEHDFETIGKQVMILNARQIVTEEKGQNLILLAIEVQ
ncbi:MAG: chemotaxis protein CheB [Promethearchaeota archaeon]